MQIYANERKESVVEFLLSTVAHYKALGVTIKRLLTDNGSAYRSRLFAKTCQALARRCKRRIASQISPPRRCRSQEDQAKDETLVSDLLALVDPLTRGDPQSPLRWTCMSLRTLAEQLRAGGFKWVAQHEG